jgi:hypothetical protein
MGFSFIIQIARRNDWKSLLNGTASFDRHAERERLQEKGRLARNTSRPM